MSQMGSIKDRDEKIQFINKLGGRSGKNTSDEVQSYNRRRTKRKAENDFRELPQIVTDQRLAALRRKALEGKRADIESKLGALTEISKTDPALRDVVNKLGPAFDKFKQLMAGDLSQEAINTNCVMLGDQVLRQLTGALDKVAPGFAEFLVEYERMEGGKLLEESNAIDPGLEQELEKIYDDVVKHGKAQDGRKKLQALQLKCQKTLDEHQPNQGAYDVEKQRVDDHNKSGSELQTVLALKKGEQGSPNDAYKALLRGALADASSWLLDGPELTSIAKAKKANDELDALLADLKNNAFSANKTARFVKPLEYVIAFGPNAAKFDAAHLGNSKAAHDLKGNWPSTMKSNLKTATENDFTKVTNAQTAIQEIFKQSTDTWKRALKDAGHLIKLAQRAAASTQQDEDTDPTDTARTKETKKAHQDAIAITTLYGQALDEAKSLDYLTALVTLAQVSVLGEQLKTAADNAIQQGVQETANAEREEKECFALFDKKFDTNSDAWRYMSGEARDEDGNPIPSDHLMKLMAIAEKAMKRWRAMTEKGIDPVTAGERAFANIPKNFWPPDAVRAVAMFRRAEAFFEEEERAKQVEQALTAGKVMGQTVNFLDDNRSKFLQEVPNQVGENIKKGLEFQYGDGIKAALKEQHPEWSDKQLEKEVNEKIKDMPAGQAAEALTYFAGGIKVAFSMFKVATDVVDLVEKQKAMSEEEASPVAAKMKEFERNRAIAHLVLDSMDAILNCAGVLNDIVPGLGIGADAKDLAQNIIEAGRYFMMLGETVKIRGKAKKDPETMMHLALAKEAKEELLYGAQRVFNAGVALLKVAGGAAEVAGPASPAGFAIKKGAVVLEYCGKFCFYLNKKISNARCKKMLARARVKPIDYEATEDVFSHSRDYARFCIAYGCTDGNDPWARQQVLGRGLTDADLDNPETTAGIIREYLNVTFEGLSGNTQEDEEWRKPKQKKERPEDKPYVGMWEASSTSLIDWDNNVDGALQDELYNDKSSLKLLSKAMADGAGFVDEYELALPIYQDAKAAFNETGANTDKVAFQNATEDLLTKLMAMIPAVNLIHAELMDYTPRKKSGSKLKRPKQEHKAMKDYCILMAKRIYELVSEAEEVKRVAEADLKIAKAGSKAKAQQEEQQQMQQLTEQNRQQVAKRRQEIDKEFEGLWDEAKLNTPWKERCKFDEIEAKCLVLGLTPGNAKTLQTNFDEKAETVWNDYVQRFYGFEQSPPPTLQGKGREVFLKNEAKRLTNFMKAKLKNAVGELEQFLLERSSELVKTEQQNNPQIVNQQDFLFTLQNPSALTSADWEENKKRADKKGWVRKSTGISEALAKFEEADRRWKMVELDLLLMAEWRIAFQRLDTCLNKWQPLATNGILHPTMNDYKASLKKALVEAHKYYRGKTANAPKAGGASGSWTPSDSELGSWPLTVAGWEDIQDLAESNRWKKNSPNGTTKAFKKVDEQEDLYKKAPQNAKNAMAAPLKTALGGLKDKLGKFGDKHYKFKKGDAVFIGMKNYVEKMKTKVDQRISELP